MNNYIDKHGRWHIKPVTEDKPYPTNNAYIYSFYAQTVGLPVEFSDIVKYHSLLDLDKVVLTRHPNKKFPDTPAISHDEYVGAAGLDQTYAADIVDFGENNYWQFCDIPGFTPTPFRKFVIDDVIAAYEDLANDPETNTRKAVVKYPDLWSIAFWHRPEQQYFYYRCAGRSPGIIRTMYFIIATIVSIFKKDQASPMLGFKFLKLEKQGLSFVEKMLYKLYKKRVDFKAVCRKYFPADHPILEAILAKE